jgi:DNA polymerase-3 subunit beta
MKIQVTQENFNKALTSVARIANTRNTLPILSNVLIKTIDNRVCVAATNLNIAISHYIGSKVKDKGGITVPARLTQEFVSSISSGVIDVSLEENKLHIKTDQYNSTINGVPIDDFPVMPKIEKGIDWKTNAKTLKTALVQVVGAASNDEARPVLTSVYFFTQDGSLFVAATDSYRLAEKRVVKLKKDGIKLLVPATSAQELLRLIGDFTGDIEVKHDDQQVLFKIEDIELVTRLIEGEYPDYQKLIPSKFASSAKLDKTDFINITKVSSLFARESAGSVTVEADESAKQIGIRSIASQLGENTATAKAEVTGGGTITLNSRYILDTLNVIEGQSTTVSFNGKLEPCVIRSDEDPDYTHVIMPLKS